MLHTHHDTVYLEPTFFTNHIGILESRQLGGREMPKDEKHGIAALKKFVEAIFCKTSDRNKTMINDTSYRPIEDLFPLLCYGKLPAIHEISQSMNSFQAEVMYKNMAKRCSFVRLRKNEEIAYTINDDNDTERHQKSFSDALTLILDGEFDLTNYKYYCKRRGMYIDQSESNVGKTLSFKVGDYISKLETENLLRYLPKEEKKVKEIDWSSYDFDDDLDEEESNMELRPTYRVTSETALLMKIPRPILRCGNPNIGIFQGQLLPMLVGIKKRMETVNADDDLMSCVVPMLQGILSNFLKNIFPTMSTIDVTKFCRHIEYNSYDPGEEVLHPRQIVQTKASFHVVLNGEVDVAEVDHEVADSLNDSEKSSCRTVVKRANDYFGPWSTYDNSWTYANTSTSSSATTTISIKSKSFDDLKDVFFRNFICSSSMKKVLIRMSTASKLGQADTESIDMILKSSYYFSTFSKASRLELIQNSMVAEIHHVAENHVRQLYMKGDVGDCIYYLLDGTVELEGDEVISRSAPSIFGTSPLCNITNRPFTCHMKQTCVLLKVYSKEIALILSNADKRFLKHDTTKINHKCMYG